MPLTREFSWSYSRFRCFNFCRTAYRLRYMDSWEGWDKFANPDAKILYQLKNLKTIRSWTDQVFRDAVRDVFIKSRNGYERFSAAEIGKTALRKLRTDWMGMLAGEWEKDPKKLNLLELFYSTPADRRDFNVQYLADSILKRTDKLASSSLFTELAEIPYLDYRDFKKPDYFVLDGIKVWTCPDFIYSRRDGTLNILNFFNGIPSDNESWDFRSAVGVLFAEMKFNTPEDRLNCQNLFFRDADEDILCVYSYRNLCEVRRIIYESSVDMVDFENCGTDVMESKSVGKCGTCEFRRVCEGKPALLT